MVVAKRQLKVDLKHLRFIVVFEVVVAFEIVVAFKVDAWVVPENSRRSKHMKIITWIARINIVA